MIAKRLRMFFVLFAVFVTGSAWAVNVGYYEMCQGEGADYQLPPIVAAGGTPVLLTDLTSSDLAGINILFVTNCSNGDFDAEYLSRLADIEAAVNGGMSLVIHDRFVEEAATILPGGSGFVIIRDTDNNDDVIDVLNNTTLVTNGPGGVIDNNTLDGGTSSSHGYAEASSLPGTAALILSRTNPDEIVSFSYPFGNGCVFYSTIPLDYYLNGSGPQAVQDAMNDIYAVNVVAYAAECASGSMQSVAVDPAGRFVLYTTSRECGNTLLTFQRTSTADGMPIGTPIFLTDCSQAVTDIDVMREGTTNDYWVSFGTSAGKYLMRMSHRGGIVKGPVKIINAESGAMGPAAISGPGNPGASIYMWIAAEGRVYRAIIDKATLTRQGGLADLGVMATPSSLQATQAARKRRLAYEDTDTLTAANLTNSGLSAGTFFGLVPSHAGMHRTGGIAADGKMAFSVVDSDSLYIQNIGKNGPGGPASETAFGGGLSAADVSNPVGTYRFVVYRNGIGVYLQKTTFSGANVGTPILIGF